MNGLYSLLLFLFVFGGAVGVLNGLNAFPDNQLPNPGYKLENTTVTELQSAGTSMSTSDFSVWRLIQIFMTALGSGITSVFLVGVVIYGFMMSLGADWSVTVAISGLIQMVVSYITVFGLYELWTGRSVT